MLLLGRLKRALLAVLGGEQDIAKCELLELTAEDWNNAQVGHYITLLNSLAWNGRDPARNRSVCAVVAESEIEDYFIRPFLCDQVRANKRWRNVIFIAGSPDHNNVARGRNYEEAGLDAYGLAPGTWICGLRTHGEYAGHVLRGNRGRVADSGVV